MRKQIVSVLLPAAAVLALNVGPVWGQSPGSGQDNSIGGTQSQRDPDTDNPIPKGAELGTDKSPRSSSQTPRQSQSNKDTSVGGSQSERAGGDSDTPMAPHGSGKSRASQSPRTGQSNRDISSAPASRAGDRSQSFGMSGQQDVRQAQEALKAQGHDPGPIDGLMGPQTRQALKEFQSSNGLQQTGRLDAETKDKLNIENSSDRGSGAMERDDSSRQKGSSSPMGR